MMKRFLIVVGGVLVLAIGAVAAMAQAGQGISSACRNVDGQTNSVVRIGVPDDAVSGGSGIVGCRVIHDGNRFVLSPAVIGDLGVIRRGVQGAVSVFGVNSSGSVANFGSEVQICLRGTGTMIFMNNAFTPRLVAEMPAITRTLETGDYTCTFISSSGIAVLVGGPAAPNESTVNLTPTESSPASTETTEAQVSTTTTVTSADGITRLSGCRATTTAMVRLREEANTNSGIVTRLPYQFSLQATARTNDWVQVIWQDRQGWVSANYLNLSAGCSD